MTKEGESDPAPNLSANWTRHPPRSRKNLVAAGPLPLPCRLVEGAVVDF